MLSHSWKNLLNLGKKKVKGNKMNKSSFCCRWTVKKLDTLLNFWINQKEIEQIFCTKISHIFRARQIHDPKSRRGLISRSQKKDPTSGPAWASSDQTSQISVPRSTIKLKAGGPGAKPQVGLHREADLGNLPAHLRTDTLTINVNN